MTKLNNGKFIRCLTFFSHNKLWSLDDWTSELIKEAERRWLNSGNVAALTLQGL